MTKQAMCDALLRFINQRSGIDFRNYQSGDWKASREAFNGDYRPMMRHGKQARQMLRAVELRESITADMLKEASGAYAGRLKFVQDGDKVRIDYTTGQYFPTEYRAAACAVLAQCLWNYWLSSNPELKSDIGGTVFRLWIQKQARRELGRGIASKWFN